MSLYLKKIEDKKENVIVIEPNCVDDFMNAFLMIFQALSKPLGGILTPFLKPILSNIEEYKRILLKYGQISFTYDDKTYIIVVRRTK